MLRLSIGLRKHLSSRGKVGLEEKKEVRLGLEAAMEAPKVGTWGTNTGNEACKGAVARGLLSGATKGALSPLLFSLFSLWCVGVGAGREV